jgi:ADP-ribose pyrophosphatase
MEDPQNYITAYFNYKADHERLFNNPDDSPFEIVFDPTLQQAEAAGLIYQADHYVLLRDAVRLRDGSITAYMRLIPAVNQSGAAVLPIINNTIVLVHQFRHATHEWQWEIPRGYPQRGERPAETAQRILLQELGSQASELTDLGGIHPDTGITNVRAHLFLGRLTNIGQSDPNKGIDRTQSVSMREFDAMVRRQDITDSFTLGAIFRARLLELL